MPEDKLQFKISSALKNLIGKELITDEYVAVFELVKNSFDAYATKVEIVFENIYSDQQNRKIIIKDNGKGMNYNDLVNKWLFVAYSAKIEGTEDNDEESKTEYRNKIQANRVFAGAKGIGRFSCDRLGSKLNLISVKDTPNAKFERLNVDWEDFELDQKKEFVNIKVKHETVEKTNYANFNKGTILEITDLRDVWDRARLQKLKQSLEKLINPNQENDYRNFKVFLKAQEEIQNDKDEEFERNKINGEIKNFLFETLEIKTTQIVTQIISDGEQIYTKLTDRGKTIYELKEKNPYPLHSKVSIHLFLLNRAAKLNFSKIMGIRAWAYGSVFLYKNGFRIYPFGEIGEDILKIDHRKQQGYNRFLGTRDLLGRIEINDSENIDNFKETTSRDGGLIKNENYYSLEDFFFNKALRRLEKYVVDLIKWGDPLVELDGKELKPEDIRKDIIEMIANIAKEDGIIELDYDGKNLTSLLRERSDENLPKNLKTFEILAEKTNNPELQKKARQLVSQFKKHNKALVETQKDLEKKSEEKKEKEKELQQKKSQIKFFQSLISRDYDQAINFLHHVGVIANTIDNHLESFNRLNKNKKEIPKEDVFTFLSKVNFSIKKILSYADFATKANYKIEEQFINDDLKEFVVQYLEDIKEKYLEKGVSLQINENSSKPFNKSFQPINYKIIFDNLLNNSRKAKAKKIVIDFYTVSNELLIKYADDGLGLDKSIQNPNDIFDMGFTTTKGSGLGLYHVKQIVKDENGSINVKSDLNKGIEFIIKVKK